MKKPARSGLSGTGHRKAGTSDDTCIRFGPATDSQTAQPSFVELLAKHQRNGRWRYQVRGIGELTMIAIPPVTRAEAEQSIRQHFGSRLISLQPVVEDSP